MFSEQYGRKDNDMHKRRSKSKDDEKALRFDQLEDKLKAEMKDMSVKDKEKEKDGKAEMKYSSAVQIEVSEDFKCMLPTQLVPSYMHH
ncbi:hypothetical protein OSTOST_14463 [Ostertagia ostertagi]